MLLQYYVLSYSTHLLTLSTDLKYVNSIARWKLVTLKSSLSD